MKLTRIRLLGFGTFHQGIDIPLDPNGLNLIVGRNEAGKSTLLTGILGVLFGFRDLNLVRKFEPWDDHEAYAGSVEVLDREGHTLRIQRDFRTNETSVLRLGDEDEQIFDGVADPRANTDASHSYYEIVRSLLGFRDEAVFRNTVFFGQSSLQTEISDQIRRLLTGSTDVDYKGALHELHSQYAELTNENPWRTKGKRKNRLIEETSGRLEEDRRALSRGKDTLVRTLELEEEIGRLQEAIGQSETEVQRVTRELGGIDRLVPVLSRREHAATRYRDALERRDNLKRHQARATEIDRVIAERFVNYRTVPSDFEKLVHAYSRSEADLARLEEKIREDRKRRKSLVKQPNVRLGVTFATAGITVGGLIGAVGQMGLPAAAALAGGFALLGFFVGRRTGTGYAEERAALDGRIASTEAEARGQRKRIMEIEGIVGPMIVGRKEEELLSEYKRLLELRAEKSHAQAAVTTLGSAHHVETAFDEAAREQGSVEASFEQVVAEWPELSGRGDRSALVVTGNQLRQRLERLRAGHERDRLRLEEARVELASLSARMDFDLVAIEDDIRAEERRLDAYDLEREALKQAIDVLDECIKDFQESDVHRLGSEISTLFSRITGEKYARVHLGTGMEPIVNRGDHLPITPSDLSQGARDQLYFAMRVAMARHLAREIRLPLFLDDPFVNFDEERLEVTHTVLQQLETDHQILMVTCDRSYTDWTSKIIDLDRLRPARN